MKKKLFVITVTLMLTPLLSLSQNTPPVAEPKPMVTVPLEDANLLIRDVQTLDEVKKQRDHLEAINHELQQRVKLSQMTVASKDSQIALLQRQVEALLQDAKTTALDVLKEIGKYLVGAAIGIGVALVAF